jgi:hypothetical protein
MSVGTDDGKDRAPYKSQQLKDEATADVPRATIPVTQADAPRATIPVSTQEVAAPRATIPINQADAPPAAIPVTQQVKARARAEKVVDDDDSDENSFNWGDGLDDDDPLDNIVDNLEEEIIDDDELIDKIPDEDEDGLLGVEDRMIDDELEDLDEHAAKWEAYIARKAADIGKSFLVEHKKSKTTWKWTIIEDHIPDKEIVRV